MLERQGKNRERKFHKPPEAGSPPPFPSRGEDATALSRASREPLVSVIVPCYNERRTIGLLLEALARQDFPPEDMEVLVVDGRSTDGTREALAAFQSRVPYTLRVLDNPQRHIPAALNLGIAHARGRMIVRLDAHSRPMPDYLSRCVEVLSRVPNVGNVGGVWLIEPSRPESWVSRSIAVAAAHPLGMGDSPYRRLNRPAGPVDTVPFGAFPREVFDRVGRFDESLLTNEDYEFNIRLRKAGWVVWLDPSIRSVYYARPTLTALARQYARCGYWKAQVVKRYPDTLRWRQGVPPLFVALTLLWLALGLLGWPWAWGLLVLQWGLYLTALLAAGVWEAWRRRDLLLAVGVPLAMATMHLAWGGAFWVGLVHRRKS